MLHVPGGTIGPMRTGFAAMALAAVMLPLAIPVAHNDEYTIYRDQIGSDGSISLSPSVLANDTGVSLTAHAVTTSEGITLTSAGIVKVHFNPGSFRPGASVTNTYYARNNAGQNSANAQYKVTLGNRQPVCRPDNYTVMAGSTLTISGAGVLLNDSDPENDPLVVKAMPAGESPAHGTLTRLGDSGFKYVAAADYSGTDSFRYQVNDRPANADPAAYKECTGQVTVNVRTASTSPSADPTPDLTTPAAPAESPSTQAAPVLPASKPDSNSGAHWWLYLMGAMVFVAGMILLIFLMRRRGDVRSDGTEPTLRFGPNDLR